MQPTHSSLPPSTTHFHPHRGPHDHPPPPTPSNWRAPEYVLYIHTRALMSVPVLLPALPLPPPLRRGENKKEIERWHRRVRVGGSGVKKRQRLYDEGWPKPPLFLSFFLYLYPVAPTHTPLGTLSSNVVININGAAQYSPDLASPCVYLRSISLLGQAISSSPHIACRTLACDKFTLLRFPGPSLTLRRVILVGMPRMPEVERVYSSLLSKRAKH